MSSESSLTPPEGWFTFGTHADQSLVLEFSSEVDEAGMPLWERPKPEGDEAEERVSAMFVYATGNRIGGAPQVMQVQNDVTISAVGEIVAIMERGDLSNPVSVVNEAEDAIAPVLFALGHDAAGYARDVIAVLAEKGLLRS